ncbi:MAG TPA: hypothetical protein VE153_20180 [Myxococcus sp.]|nr:hypothetical protein [Myxococcus sp.]
MGSTKRLKVVLAPPPLRASPDALLLVVLGAVGVGGGGSAWLSHGGFGPAVAVPWAVGAVLMALGLGLVQWRKRRGGGLLTLDRGFVIFTRGDEEKRFLLERLNAVIQTRGSDSRGTLRTMQLWDLDGRVQVRFYLPAEGNAAFQAFRQRLSEVALQCDVQYLGDAAREYEHLERGLYDATAHVFLAFLLQGILLTMLVLTPLLWVLLPGVQLPMDGPLYYVCYLGGCAVAWLIFRDHWKVTEATASRLASGVANLSIFYVPLVALGYANLRALRRLFGR